MKPLIALLAAGFLAGCSSTGTYYGQSEGASVETGATNAVAYKSAYDVDARAYTEEELMADTTIYFEFDKTNVRNSDYHLILAHADYLSKHPNKKVRLVGHTDERGTREYNLALGENRANAVSQMLVVNGISKKQIETVSYGEEAPADAGHHESAWKMNRRVEIEY